MDPGPKVSGPGAVALHREMFDPKLVAQRQTRLAGLDERVLDLESAA